MNREQIIEIYNKLEVGKVYTLKELNDIFQKAHDTFNMLFFFGSCKKVKEDVVEWTEEERQEVKAEYGENVIFKPQTIRYYELTKKYNILQVIINIHNISNTMNNLPPLECWFDSGYYVIVDYAYKNDSKKIFRANNITIKHTDCYIKAYRDFLIENDYKDFICLNDDKEYWLNASEAEELGECEVIFDD